MNDATRKLRPAEGRPTRRGRGFTMIELLLVCVTIAIVAAMAVPRYGQALSNYRARCAAQRVAADLAAAAGAAVASSGAHAVTFDVATHQYRVGTNDPVRLTVEPYSSAIVSADLGGDAVVNYDGYGVPDSGGTIVIRSGNVTRTVTLDPITGRASVK